MLLDILLNLALSVKKPDAAEISRGMGHRCWMNGWLSYRNLHGLRTSMHRSGIFWRLRISMIINWLPAKCPIAGGGLWGEGLESACEEDIVRQADCHSQPITINSTANPSRKERGSSRCFAPQDTERPCSIAQ